MLKSTPNKQRQQLHILFVYSINERGVCVGGGGGGVLGLVNVSKQFFYLG